MQIHLDFFFLSLSLSLGISSCNILGILDIFLLFSPLLRILYDDAIYSQAQWGIRFFERLYWAIACTSGGCEVKWMGLGMDRNNPKTFDTTVYGLTHPNVDLFGKKKRGGKVQKKRESLMIQHHVESFVEPKRIMHGQRARNGQIWLHAQWYILKYRIWLCASWVQLWARIYFQSNIRAPKNLYITFKSNIQAPKIPYITFKSNIRAQKWTQIGSNIRYFKMYHWVIGVVVQFQNYHEFLIFKNCFFLIKSFTLNIFVSPKILLFLKKF